MSIFLHFGLRFRRTTFGIKRPKAEGPRCGQRETLEEEGESVRGVTPGFEFGRRNLFEGTHTTREDLLRDGEMVWTLPSTEGV